MTSGTQTIQAGNKLQASNNATGKAKASGADPKGIPFEALFSNALSQGKPNAQLNAIEAQLRESLFKDEKKPARSENEAALNIEAAQSAVWAQRNWMQQSASNTGGLVGSSNAAKPAQPTATANTTAVATQNRAPSETKPATTENSAEPASKPEQDGRQTPTNASNTANPSSNGNSAPAQPSQATMASAPGTPIDQAATPSLSKVELLDKSTVSAPTTTPTVQAMPTEQAAPATSDRKATPALMSKEELPATVQTEVPEASGKTNTANLQVKVDAGASTAAPRTELPAAVAANNTAASNVAAQVAPQIAPQVAKQQFSLKGEEFTSLKTGDKIMATGAASTNQTNAAALPTTLNGLGTTSANPQALIKTPVNQPGFAKEVGQTVQWALGKNMSTVDIRVNPETFGPMNMRLIQKGQQVQLIIRTQDESAANLLAQALGGLKEVLGQNGLQLSQVQIQHGQPQQANQQANPHAGDTANQQFAQQQQGGQRGGSGSGQPTDEPDAIAGHSAQTNKRPDAKLDLFA